MTHGANCLFCIVKPYLPYDVIPTPILTTTFTSTLSKNNGNYVHKSAPLGVPDWIADCEPLKPVLFSIEAYASLKKLSEAGHTDTFLYCTDMKHARDFIVQGLYHERLSFCC